MYERPQEEQREPYDHTDEPSELTIGEVAKQQRDFANRIARLSFVVQHSLIHDIVIDKALAKDIWRDEFLTNVMVPFLQHILEVTQGDYTQIKENYEDEVYRRGESVVKEELNDLNSRMGSLMHVIHTLKEWRG